MLLARQQIAEMFGDYQSRRILASGGYCLQVEKEHSNQFGVNLFQGGYVASMARPFAPNEDWALVLGESNAKLMEEGIFCLNGES